jgi:hypothetical protein
MMPNFQPTPHECHEGAAQKTTTHHDPDATLRNLNLNLSKGVRSDLEGGASLSRGGGVGSRLRASGSSVRRSRGCSGLGGLTGAPESCCVFKAEIAALKQDVAELEIHRDGQWAVNDKLSDQLIGLKATVADLRNQLAWAKANQPVRECRVCEKDVGDICPRCKDRPGGPLKPLGEILSRAESIRLLESGPPLGMPHCGAEVDQLKADLDTALEYVEDAVNQACQITEDSGAMVLDTMCSGTWESALDYLHRLGRVTEIIPGRVYAFPWMVEKNAKAKEANHG